MKLRSDLMITHPFKAKDRPSEWMCVCGKPRALHSNDGFVAQFKGSIQMDPGCIYGRHKYWAKPKPWTIKESEEFNRDLGKTRARRLPGVEQEQPARYKR